MKRIGKNLLVIECIIGIAVFGIGLAMKSRSAGCTNSWTRLQWLRRIM